MRKGRKKEKNQIWYAFNLWIDVVFVKFILVFIQLTNKYEPNPDIYFYLSNMYGLLFKYYKNKGNDKRTNRLDKKAEYYFNLSGGDMPPAKSAAMPIPRPPIFVKAVGK